MFNAPFANTRSVAEMVIAQTVFLMRQMGDRMIECHQGKWNKVSNNCYEVCEYIHIIYISTLNPLHLLVICYNIAFYYLIIIPYFAYYSTLVP